MSSIDMELEVEASGKTHQGNVRDGNEDAMLVAPELGLFAVLDGMGGARAGEVASSTACDVLHDHVRAHKSSQQPAELIETAIRSANARVHREARDNRERHGMGTTVVACLFIDEEHALVAHVGDSRAYLWREGRMQLLTRDHTIVADLVAKNIITASEAEHHPYSNVLSRNLGSKSDVKVDVLELSLQPGDRLLLCSDGLSGYASNDAIAQILGGNDVPEHTAEDLIALALRGGGGDNVTAIVIDAGEPEVPHDTRIIRTSGAEAWWRRRQMFFEAARERGLCESPVCSVLSPDEALEIVAGNLCEAIFRDLEQTTGINVWTYAENLGRGWFDQDGSFMVLRNLIDILRYAADAVLADIATEGEPFATGLDIAVTRALIVAEMAIGGLLAEKLRQIEAELVRLRAHEEVTFTGEPTAQHGFSEQPTVPCMPTGRSEPPPPEVAQCLTAALALAEEDVRKRSSRVSAGDCLQRAHMAALDPVRPGDVELSAREMVSASLIDEGGISPLLDALDRARNSHFQAIRHTSASPDVRAAAMRRAAIAHRRMMTVVSGLVVEYGQPIIETLHNVTATTAELRSQVGKGEARLGELERRYASRKSPAHAPRSQP